MRTEYGDQSRTPGNWLVPLILEHTIDLLQFNTLW